MDGAAIELHRSVAVYHVRDVFDLVAMVACVTTHSIDPFAVSIGFLFRSFVFSRSVGFRNQRFERLANTCAFQG